ncbi:MAG: tetratricopeptide repeat protein [Lachnospiraceae bacterium]
MGFFTASRLNKMKSSFRDGDLDKAVVFAEKINPSEIRTTYDLSMMADIYMAAGRLGAARRVYGEMYKRNKTIRVCKQLIDLNIKLKNLKQAVFYLKELNAMDSEDYERFIYQYQLGKALNQPDEYLIECLKKVREADYIAKWAMELAKLFFKVGSNDECVTECQNIKLWFPDTDYAYKADMLLRACNSGTTYADAVSEAVNTAQTESVEEEFAEEESVEEEFAEEESEEEEFTEEEFTEEEFAEEESFEEAAALESEEPYFKDDSDEEVYPDEEPEEDQAPVRSYDMRRNIEESPAMTEISTDESDEIFFNISDSVKDIMESEKNEKSSPEPEREDIATTLINDSLTAEVMEALRKLERQEATGDKDAVDESILKMIDEE